MKFFENCSMPKMRIPTLKETAFGLIYAGSNLFMLGVGRETIKHDINFVKPGADAKNDPVTTWTMGPGGLAILAGGLLLAVDQWKNGGYQEILDTADDAAAHTPA